MRHSFAALNFHPSNVYLPEAHHPIVVVFRLNVPAYE
jgi:hypothetical protein